MILEVAENLAGEWHGVRLWQAGDSRSQGRGMIGMGLRALLPATLGLKRYRCAMLIARPGVDRRHGRVAHRVVDVLADRQWREYLDGGCPSPPLNLLRVFARVAAW